MVKGGCILYDCSIITMRYGLVRGGGRWTCSVMCAPPRANRSRLQSPVVDTGWRSGRCESSELQAGNVCRVTCGRRTRYNETVAVGVFFPPPPPLFPRLLLSTPVLFQTASLVLIWSLCCVPGVGIGRWHRHVGSELLRSFCSWWILCCAFWSGGTLTLTGWVQLDRPARALSLTPRARTGRLCSWTDCGCLRSLSHCH